MSGATATAPTWTDHQVEGLGAVEPRSKAWRWSSLVGLLLVAISSFFFSISSMLVKFLARRGFDPIFVAWSRCPLPVVAGGLYCYFHRYNVFPPVGTKIRCFILMRGTFGMASVSLYFYCISKLPLADATVLFFTSPIWGAVWARVWLGEPLRLVHPLAALLSFGGVVLVARPPFIFGRWSASYDEQYGTFLERLPATLVGLFSAVLGSLAMCSVRRVGKTVHPLAHVFWLGVAGIPVLGVLTLVFDRPPPIDAPVGFLVSCAAVLGQIVLNKGLQMVQAGPGMVLRNMDIVFALMWQGTLLGSDVTWPSILGAVLVSCGACIIVLWVYCAARRERADATLLADTPGNSDRGALADDNDQRT